MTSEGKESINVQKGEHYLTVSNTQETILKVGLNGWFKRPRFYFAIQDNPTVAAGAAWSLSSVY